MDGWVEGWMDGWVGGWLFDSVYGKIWGRNVEYRVLQSLISSLRNQSCDPE